MRAPPVHDFTTKVLVTGSIASPMPAEGFEPPTTRLRSADSPSCLIHRLFAGVFDRPSEQLQDKQL
jgi:hypothetical protein